MTLTCPYCGNMFRESDDDHVPNEKYEGECYKCGKFFAYEIEYQILTKSYRAPCMNEGDHDWTTQECYPEFMTQRTCPCGESEYIYKDQERQAMADKYYREIKRDL